MNNILVGYTGFVGSNLVKSFCFDNLYNSKNIEQSFYTNPDLLVYSGVRAEKFLANKNPDEDLKVVENAIDNIKKINAKRVVLISTIDVYKTPINVDEDSVIETENLHPYGLNRYHLEKWVEENIKDSLIVRLPGLYGENIKKNFIFDLINVIPSMLNQEKFKELRLKSDLIGMFYLKQENGFYKCKELNSKEKNLLKQEFEKLQFSALNFTDSRGNFQFYNLKYLWNHIQIALQNNIKKLNLATEPVTVSAMFKYIKGTEFKNEFAKVVPNYDFQTKYSDLFYGEKGYIFDKKFILNDIKNFIEQNV